ncbi:MAG: hypothetical protein ACK5RX_03705 [bacterium]
MPRNASRLHIAGRPPLALTGASSHDELRGFSRQSMRRALEKLLLHG